MAAKKYIALNVGRQQEMSATQASAGAANEGDIVALDSSGRLDPSMMPVGVGADAQTLVASEALSAGDFVSVWNDAGTMKARRADATASGKEADGFVLSAVSNGQDALVYFEGRNTALTGLTGGARYYLATTAGQVTTTPPSASGNVVQYIGRAIGTTTISFEGDDGVILA